MLIYLESGRFGTYLITAEDGRDTLIQTDWDYPGTARSFGWSPDPVEVGGEECDHDGTDGTIDCGGCGRTADEFINEAREYLDAEPGPVEDPGYFSE